MKIIMKILGIVVALALLGKSHPLGVVLGRFAFVWMGLVAIGLVLILVRVLCGHDNRWLVRWNLVTLAATLYACSLVNFPALIAQYNVEHSREISGDGPPLDVYYLASPG